jgi:hypothetical protein
VCGVHVWCVMCGCVWFVMCVCGVHMWCVCVCVGGVCVLCMCGV